MILLTGEDIHAVNNMLGVWMENDVARSFLIKFRGKIRRFYYRLFGNIRPLNFHFEITADGQCRTETETDRMFPNADNLLPFNRLCAILYPVLL